jgi:cobalt/nickel transport system permease protein
MAFPDPASGFPGSLVKFLGIFAVTQIPLAVSEGLLTVLVMNLLVTYSQPELRALAVLKKEA